MSQRSLFDFGVSKKRKADESDRADSLESDQHDDLSVISVQPKKQKTDSDSPKGPSKLYEFQSGWLKKFEWLEYNAGSKHMFCNVCRAANSKNSFTREGAGV